MLNTYIKNRGLTQTIVHTNNHDQFNELNWDANYDGNLANISVMSNMDGNKKHYNVTLDNEDLANMLNVPSIGMPIDKRLQMDFVKPSFRNDPKILQIELPDLKTPDFLQREPYFVNDDKSKTLGLESSIPSSYLSSHPEELLLPITIDDKYTLTQKRRHNKKTHKAYKKSKSPKSKSPKSKSPKSKSPKSKSKSKTAKRFSIF